MDFHIGSGLAALTQIGNEAEDLRFYGGRYGILTDNTSPFWQFTLIDSVFDGQREAAIREHMAGLTLIRDTFRNVPVGIDIDPHYSDQLWVKDSRFENVSQRRRRHQQREERDDPDRRSRTRCARTCRCSRDSARAARPQAGAGADLPGRELQPRPRRARRGHDRASSTRSTSAEPLRRCRRRCRRRSAPLPPTDELGQRAHARREGRRADRRHRRASRRPSTRIACSTSRPASTSSATRSR